MYRGCSIEGCLHSCRVSPEWTDLNMSLNVASGRRMGVLVSYAYTACNILVQLIYVPLLLSSIGQEEYGLYQLIGSVVAYIVSINGVLAAGVGRYYCMYKAANDRLNMENTLAIAKRMYWIMSAVTTLAVVVVIGVFRSVYQVTFTTAQIDECSLMLIVLGINCVVTMNNAINISVLTAHERFVFLKGSQIIALIAQPIIVLILTRVWRSALVVTCVVLAMNFLCACAQRLYVTNVLNEHYSYHGWDWSLAKGLVAFSGVIILVALADQIFWKTDQLIIGYFFGAASVAVYAVGSQIYTAYMSVGATISSVFLARVSELYHRDHDMQAISALFIRVGRLSLMVCLAVLGGFIIFGIDFVSLWAGDGFKEAYYVALIIMTPFTIDLIQNLGITVMQVMDKYHFRGYVYVLCAVLNIPLTVCLLLLRFGLIGAAASTAIASFIGNGLIMNWYYKVKIGLDIKEFWKSMAGVVFPVLIFTALFGIGYWLLSSAHQKWTLMLFGMIMYAVGYFAVLRLFVMNDYETALADKLFRKKV